MKTNFFTNKLTNLTLLPARGERARRADEGQAKQRRSLPLFLCILALTATITGCGGGGAGVAENRPPVATVGGLVVQGVVSVRVSALAPREASVEAESVVPGAVVAFSVEGENAILSQTTSDANGRYVLPIRSGIRGRISVIKDNRQLSAIVVAASNASGVVNRDVNLESTVVEIALRNQNTLSFDVEAMEEAVRIGEAPELLNEVKTAYQTNRAPAPSTSIVSSGLVKLTGSENNATKDCIVGQEWCVVLANLEAGTTPNTYTSRLLLRRDRTGGNNAESSTATIGAGHLLVRLPAGLTMDSITGATAVGANVIADKGNVEDVNQIQISFLHEGDNGIGEAIKLADLSFTSTRTLTTEDRLIVVTQKLLGTLNEKRGGTARAAESL